MRVRFVFLRAFALNPHHDEKVPFAPHIRPVCRDWGLILLGSETSEKKGVPF